MLHDILSTAQDLILAAPTPAPTDGTAPGSGNIINTNNILTWITTVIAPIIISVIGIWILSRAKSGQTSQVVTTTGIAMLGLVFVGGAAVLAFLGDDIINLVIG